MTPLRLSHSNSELDWNIRPTEKSPKGPELGASRVGGGAEGQVVALADTHEKKRHREERRFYPTSFI